MKSIQHGLRACAGRLMGKELYRIEDGLGAIIVSQRGEKRVLSFDTGLEQSSLLVSRPHYLSHEYTQIMLLGLLFVEARHITILGLGGGGLARCLSHYYPLSTVQAVEMRQAVIDIAYEWFDLPRTPKLPVSCANAFMYMRHAERASTDLILSDLYEAKVMSEVQTHLSFVEFCYKALSDQGWIVFNFHNLPEKKSPIMEKINSLFAEVYVCDVYKGNWVMFCGKAESGFAKSELAERAKNLAKKVEMPLMYYFKQLRLL